MLPRVPASRSLRGLHGLVLAGCACAVLGLDVARGDSAARPSIQGNGTSGPNVVLEIAAADASAGPLRGVWEADFPLETRVCIIQLTPRRGRVTGTFTVAGRALEIFDGQIVKRTLRFKVMSPTGGRTVTFSGTVERDRMVLLRDVTVPPGGSPGGAGIFGSDGARTFTAKRAAHMRGAPPSTALVRPLPVTESDLRILTRADELLENESAWNRNDDRVCDDDEATRRRSLFCALQKACIDVLGSYDHRRAALEEVRSAIRIAARGRPFDHGLMEFNNLRETRFGDVKRVLQAARDVVKTRVKGGPPP